MNETLTATQTKTVEFPVSPLPVSDTAGIASAALVQAMDFCAKKMALNNREAVVDCLRRSDYNACSYFHYGLAKQVAECLGAWDEAIRAVYLCEYDATPEDACFGEARQPSLIHLLVLAYRKTSALNSLAAALDRALVESYIKLTDLRELTRLLDVQVADDADVQNRTGFGAMLSSLHHRPIQIWER